MGHVAGSICRQRPLPSEVTFVAVFRIGRDNGYEETAVVDLFADLVIPGIPTPQLTLVEPDFHSTRAKSLRDSTGSLRILGRITEEYRCGCCIHVAPVVRVLSGACIPGTVSLSDVERRSKPAHTGSFGRDGIIKQVALLKALCLGATDANEGPLRPRGGAAAHNIRMCSQLLLTVSKLARADRHSMRRQEPVAGHEQARGVADEPERAWREPRYPNSGCPSVAHRCSLADGAAAFGNRVWIRERLLLAALAVIRRR